MSLVPKQLQTQLALITQISWAPPRPEEAVSRVGLHCSQAGQPPVQPRLRWLTGFGRVRTGTVPCGPVPEPRNGCEKASGPKLLDSRWPLTAARQLMGPSCTHTPPPQGRTPEVSYVALWSARHGFPPTPPSQNELGVGWKMTLW